MKGYYVPNGYMGFVEGKYILFVSESERKKLTIQLTLADG